MSPIIKRSHHLFFFRECAYECIVCRNVSSFIVLVYRLVEIFFSLIYHVPSIVLLCLSKLLSSSALLRFGVVLSIFIYEISRGSPIYSKTKTNKGGEWWSLYGRAVDLKWPKKYKKSYNSSTTNKKIITHEQLLCCTSREENGTELHTLKYTTSHLEGEEANWDFHVCKCHFLVVSWTKYLVILPS